MKLCRATKANGEPCKAPATEPSGWCWAHAPEHASRRSRMASRAAKSKPSREIRDLKKQLEDLAASVLDGTIERGDAVVVNQILNTRARLIELERKVREQDELLERLDVLEQVTQTTGRRGPWGA
jgi:hypothetical protein